MASALEVSVVDGRDMPSSLPAPGVGYERMRPYLSSLLIVGLLACTASRTSTVSEPPAAQHARAPLPFIEDDYARAVAEAKSRGLPLFVDTWAPW
jgi:hypothetical protein